MTEKDIQTVYDGIIKALNKRTLASAFDAMDKIMSDTNMFLFLDELNALRETYKHLLFYYTEGLRDPMQARIYNELVVSAYELADKIMQRIVGKTSPHLY